MLAELRKGNAPTAETVEALSAKPQRQSKDSQMNATAVTPQIQAMLDEQTQLIGVIVDMDALVSQGLAEIRALAYMSSLALEAPSCYRFPPKSMEDIAHVFSVIETKSEEFREYVTQCVNRVGIESTTDPRVLARRNARAAAYEKNSEAAA